MAPVTRDEVGRPSSSRSLRCTILSPMARQRTASPPAIDDPAGSPRLRPRFVWRVSLKRRLLMLVFMALWTGMVLYPDPRVLVTSLRRLAHPPVDVAAVRDIAATLPDDAAAIEAYSQKYVKYEYAWKLYGKPWYFPTVREVLRDQAGDCQAEAIVTASILQAKGMPYTFRYSFDHVWVDYPGKEMNKLEDPATAFVSNAGGQGWLGSLPDKLPLRDVIDQRVRFHWTPMPAERKAIWVLGVLLGFLVGEQLIDLIWRPIPWAARMGRPPKKDRAAAEG